MDLHPITVHFPIAMLVVWSILEMLPLSKIPIVKNITWQTTKDVLLVIGFLGALVSLQTGEEAEHLTRASHNLVEMHGSFAGFATFVYGLFVAEFVFRLDFVRQWTRKIRVADSFISLYLKTFSIRWIRFIVVLIAFLALFVTGVLGGVIAYGPDKDPLAPFVLQILGL